MSMHIAFSLILLQKSHKTLCQTVLIFFQSTNNCYINDKYSEYDNLPFSQIFLFMHVKRVNAD